MAIPVRAAKDVNMSIPEQVKRESKLSEELSERERESRLVPGRKGTAEDLQEKIETLSNLLESVLEPMRFRAVLHEVEFDDDFAFRRTSWDEGVYVELAVDSAEQNALAPFFIIYKPEALEAFSRSVWTPTQEDLFAKDYVEF